MNDHRNENMFISPFVSKITVVTPGESASNSFSAPSMKSHVHLLPLFLILVLKAD